LTGSFLSLSAQVLKIGFSGGWPSSRALAALAKLNGFRLERRWPFLIPAGDNDLNLSWEDVLAFQLWRNGEPVVLVVGAFDGVTNDPTGDFIRANDTRAVLVEPQPGPFARLRENYECTPGVSLVNAAVDGSSGERDMFTVAMDGTGVPDWMEQTASFDRAHVEKHLPSEHHDKILTIVVPVMSFADLIGQYGLEKIDILQIDAEGLDVQMLEWFPFETVRPGVVHFERTHMTDYERQHVVVRLTSFGYRFVPTGSVADGVAVAL
jgi:FkbM family methyltransferase